MQMTIGFVSRPGQHLPSPPTPSRTPPCPLSGLPKTAGSKPPYPRPWKRSFTKGRSPVGPYRSPKDHNKFFDLEGVYGLRYPLILTRPTNDGSYLRHSPLNYRASIHCRNSYLITNAYTSPFETPLHDPSKNALALFAFEMAGIPVVAGEDLLPPGRLLSPFADVPATRVVAFSLFYLLGVSLPLRPFVSSPPCRNCRSAEEACLAPSTPVLPPSRGL